LAIAVARAEPSVRVVGLDSAERMLAVGRRKVENLDLADRIELVQGDARAIPFEPASFDRISMAFGIRNVSDRQGALQEMVRVGRPNARLAILELSEPRRGWSGPFARFHVHTVVPWLGSVLSGAPEYRYLQRSIERFPEPEAFASTMRAAGIDDVRIVPLTFGVCHLYLGRLRGPA
jgi:demethylmenaquinone methyltransferase/2-methoxy-6-polyprenyl-1,4-benzoquinol methylase